MKKLIAKQNELKKQMLAEIERVVRKHNGNLELVHEKEIDGHEETIYSSKSGNYYKISIDFDYMEDRTPVLFFDYVTAIFIDGKGRLLAQTENSGTVMLSELSYVQDVINMYELAMFNDNIN